MIGELVGGSAIHVKGRLDCGLRDPSYLGFRITLYDFNTGIATATAASRAAGGSPRPTHAVREEFEFARQMSHGSYE